MYAGISEKEVKMLYDRDIREPLFDFLEMKYDKIRIIEEKNMGNSRADVIAVTENGLIGIEIKSDADTYTRLESQIKDYDRYFDYNCIVAGSRHAAGVSDHVPEHWGIITVDEEEGKPDFYVMREPSLNPGMNIRDKLSLLWRPELAHIQEINGMYKYREKSRAFVIDKIIDNVSTSVLAAQITEELFERDYTLIDEIITEYKKNIDNGKKHRKKRHKRYKMMK